MWGTFSGTNRVSHGHDTTHAHGDPDAHLRDLA
jgi:hypothetical protein